MLTLNALSASNHQNTAWSSLCTNALGKLSSSKKTLCLLLCSTAGLGVVVGLAIFRYLKKKYAEDDEADENQCCISEIVRKEILESMGQQYSYTKANMDETEANTSSRLSCSSGSDTLKFEEEEESSRSTDSRMYNHNFKKVIIKSRNDDPITNGQMNGFSSQDHQTSLLETLNSLYGTNKLIKNEEAKNLILILQQKDQETMLKVMTTMCNLAAFTANQDLFRLNGALPLLVELLDDNQSDSAVRLMLTQCLGNMAVNTKNNQYLQRAAAKIVDSYTSPLCSELQKIISVQTLTNLSVEILPKYVKDFAPAVQATLDRLMTSNGPNLACLKFLINLSCCTSLASKILTSKALYDFVEILNENLSEEVIIRSLTLLTHLYNCIQNCENVQKNEQTVYDLLFEEDNFKSEIRGRLEKLKTKFANEEIQQKIDRLLETKNRS